MPLNKAVPLSAVNVCASDANMAGVQRAVEHDLHGSPHESSHLFRVRVAEMASGIVTACETASLKDLGRRKDSGVRERPHGDDRALLSGNPKAKCAEGQGHSLRLSIETKLQCSALYP